VIDDQRLRLGIFGMFECLDKLLSGERFTAASCCFTKNFDRARAWDRIRLLNATKREVGCRAKRPSCHRIEGLT